MDGNNERQVKHHSTLKWVFVLRKVAVRIFMFSKSIHHTNFYTTILLRITNNGLQR
jgi:hypothetical protein